jgi:hypothetical protein
VLGLVFNPNRHNKKKTNEKDQVAIRSDASKAQSGSGRRRLADTVYITGAQVEARTRILKKKEEETKLDPNVWRDHDPAWRC